MTKKIILCADGTCNARTSQFRTNVWKLYDALDLTPGGNQIAYYHDGVGTDSFAPLKYLGAIFGYGVAKNVCDIYSFLCRNYERGDQIYIFGFSRGAFEARMLAALISMMGVPSFNKAGNPNHIGPDWLQSEAEIEGWTAEAFSTFRRNCNWARYGLPRRIAVGIWQTFRKLLGRKSAKKISDPVRHEVEFVGAWDTVAAYGGPIVEMVRGWDRWVLPLSFADYVLPKHVKIARHALALDEERESFLPLLWDEIKSDPDQTTTRLKQVWFAGVHADVGGGYPDEGLSAVPLQWMMDETGAAAAGPLKFEPSARAKIAGWANAVAPRHDSRSGVGMAYRYQPRRIDAYTQASNGNPSRDPQTGSAPMLRKALIHPSVFDRFHLGTDDYAPISLPVVFEDTANNSYSLDPVNQSEIWKKVRSRRRLQFLMLTVGVLMVVSPFYPRHIVGIDFLNDLFAKLVHGLLAIVPGVPGWVDDLYAGCGGYLLIGMLLLALLIKRSGQVAAEIQALGTKMWRTLAMPSNSLAPKDVSWWNKLAWPVRRFFRWKFVPDLFGIAYWLIFTWCLFAIVGRVWIAAEHRSPKWCDSAPTSVFSTSEPCHPLGLIFHKGLSYRLQLAVQQPWMDGLSPHAIKTSPAGFTGAQSVWQKLQARAPLDALRALIAHVLYGPAIREEVGSNWFAPIVAVIPSGGGGPQFAVPAMEPIGNPQAGIYRGSFIAPVTGSGYLYVNDSAGPDHIFYRNNQGTAKITICSGDCLDSPSP